jgi:hypothetical protein
MPSKSKAQAKLMRAAAHNPGLAKRAGVSPSVAKEFNRADQARGAERMKRLPARKDA